MDLRCLEKKRNQRSCKAERSVFRAGWEVPITVSDYDIQRPTHFKNYFMKITWNKIRQRRILYCIEDISERCDS